jgi:hypothetical protein
MSNKEKMLAVIRSLPEGATFDQAIDRLYLLWKVEQGIAQAEAGEVTEHDEFMREILDGEDYDPMDPPGQGRPSRDQEVHSS